MKDFFELFILKNISTFIYLFLFSFGDCNNLFELCHKFFLVDFIFALHTKMFESEQIYDYT